ncbi:hypothetical protein P7D43_05380 [Enterococcus avium]|uniref:Uncharacterized protein n=1 Tax=Enterococcus avium TaxID=33945 RepID=A0AAW8SIK9_ENTAV|nr:MULTISPECIES: hypothetical protein [Enterococcus]MDT2401798.1 hypothetical protein [Enterococcus avium]MDT2434240.1 hypothetical protein [Enterococcus avium]MDT2466138.1 hypothetical protein [Enterococcus avium]MDT2484085.1 hypothetical protein [Enterococcus avium]MDT2505564.1 hypothetical protein [Enterococcus avium]
MARNPSKRKGFTPENATAGIDTTLDDFQTHTDEDTLENEKKDQVQESNITETSVPVTEVNRNFPHEKGQADSDTKQGTVNINEQDTILNGQEKKAAKKQQTQLSLEGLLEEKQKKYDKRQENVWLPPETTRPLQAISKLVGKTNGGKSKVVDMALQEFFTNHPDIVDKALELYGD